MNSDSFVFNLCGLRLGGRLKLMHCKYCPKLSQLASLAFRNTLLLRIKTKKHSNPIGLNINAIFCPVLCVE